jgi:polar amino acid transport system substrate-binding protein
MVILLALAGCTGTPGFDDREFGSAPELLIATDATFAPFHYINSRGEITGFDIELVRRLAEHAGYVPRVTVVPYERLFTELLAGRHDVVAATTGVTPERAQKYLFSAPYYDTCQAALVRVGAGEPQNLAGLVGRRVGAAGAGTSVRALDLLSGSVAVLLSDAEATESVIQLDGSVPVLENGTIDALIVDEMDAVEAARVSGGRLRVLSEPVALEQYALVLAPGQDVLKRRLDLALSELREDGTIKQLEREFGLSRGDDWPIEFPRLD